MASVETTCDPVERHIVNTNKPEGLSAIRRNDCAAAIWHRQPLSRFQTWIDGLAAENLPKSRVVLRSDAVCEALSNVAKTCGMPEGLERDLFVDDASALAFIFADIMRAEYLRVRLDVVTSNACRKFHVDAVTARLVCTYRGTGTQFGTSVDGSDPRHILTAPTGSPIILRGTRWPEAPLSGFLHRSPPIEGTGETRLVFVLDPIEDPAKELDRNFVH